MFCASYFIFSSGGWHMKRIFIGIAAVASVLATNAFGADLAARPYTKAPAIVEAGYNWTGFYVGLNGGYSWGRARETLTIGGSLSCEYLRCGEPEREWRRVRRADWL